MKIPGDNYHAHHLVNNNDNNSYKCNHTGEESFLLKLIGWFRNDKQVPLTL